MVLPCCGTLQWVLEYGEWYGIDCDPSVDKLSWEGDTFPGECVRGWHHLFTKLCMMWHWFWRLERGRITLRN